MSKRPRWDQGIDWAIIGALAVVMLVLGVAMAKAQPYPGPGSNSLEPDEFSLTVIVEGSYAIVEYYNSADRYSHFTPDELIDGDLTVPIDLVVTGGPETLYVYPPDGWVAHPPSVTVEDGETAVIELRRGEYLGS